MRGSPLPDATIEYDLKAVSRRAEAILKARPAYREMVDFYLPVFQRHIEWRDRLVVHPEPLERAQVRECLREGTPLIERHDQGIEAESLLNLWTEIKQFFRQGNEILRQALEKTDAAERAGTFMPASWLAEVRPDRDGLITSVSEKTGADEPVLKNLARAVTFPHWQRVAENWVPHGGLEEWKRPQCPVCGGPPALAETRTEKSPAEGISGAARRYLHCSFCGSHWVIANLDCPACNSTTKGDAKYLFTKNEPELRIDFCKSCRHYVKTVLADKIAGKVHVGLESLTTIHLDLMAQKENLTPLEVPHDH